MKERRTFDKAFKEQAVQLSHQEGVTVAQVARDLGVDPQLLYKWRAAHKANGADAFPGMALVTS